MTVLEWLLESDPAIRWQVLRDLVDAPDEVVAAERARVATEGWGARLLAMQGENGQWAGGACFPAGSFNWRAENRGQPWTATLPTLQLLYELGVDPGSDRVRRAVALVRNHCRWEHAGQPFFSGEVEPCINGRVVTLGIYFGHDVEGVVARLLNEQLEDGGWNCEAENGSVRSSFATTINVLEGLLAYERATGGSPNLASLGPNDHSVSECAVAPPRYSTSETALRPPFYIPDRINQASTGTSWGTNSAQGTRETRKLSISEK